MIKRSKNSRMWSHRYKRNRLPKWKLKSNRLSYWGYSSRESAKVKPLPRWRRELMNKRHTFSKREANSEKKKKNLKIRGNNWRRNGRIDRIVLNKKSRGYMEYKCRRSSKRSSINKIRKRCKKKRTSWMSRSRACRWSSKKLRKLIKSRNERKRKRQRIVKAFLKIKRDNRSLMPMITREILPSDLLTISAEIRKR